MGDGLARAVADVGSGAETLSPVSCRRTEAQRDFWFADSGKDPNRRENRFPSSTGAFVRRLAWSEMKRDSAAIPRTEGLCDNLPDATLLSVRCLDAVLDLI